jgi:hypothetical protein
MRTKVYLLIAATLCFIAAAVCVYLGVGAPAAGFSAVESVRDLGEVHQLEELRTTFELINRFSQFVEIKKVVRSCGCTDVVVATNSIGPGEKTTLEATWNTGYSRGREGVDLWVVYTLADGREGGAKLRIEGTILPDINYEPSVVAFDSTSRGERAVQFLPGRLSTFNLKNAKCSHMAFSADLDSAHARVRVSIEPQKWVPEDEARPVLSVDCDSARVPTLRIPIIVNLGSVLIVR